MSVVIQVENLSKYYRLGLIGGGTLREDLNRWWAKARGRPDPLLKIGDTDHGNRVGGELWALRDVSFQVREGEILGIIGRNGAGKSTLLKILSRITAPTTGQVKIKGRVGSLLEVGTGFHPELTGRENIYLNGAILGMKKAEIDRKLDEIIDFAEIEQFIDTPVKRYSSGMYVRLAFAVAAHLEPEILIVDEVLAVGDVAFQKKCLGKMGDVAKSGRTVLFVSHNILAIENLCSSVLILKAGRVADIGSPERVITVYLQDLNTIKQNSIKLEFAELSMTFEAIDSQKKNSFRTGDFIRFKVNLKVDRPVRNANFGIGVEDQHGQRVLTFHTQYQHANVWGIVENVEMVVDWDECILCPGTYHLIAALYENNQLALAWNNIDDLTITDADIYGTGKLPDARHQGKVITKAIWKIQERNTLKQNS
jgi:lipopolysaccharide transport system ATP-binding protein